MSEQCRQDKDHHPTAFAIILLVVLVVSPLRLGLAQNLVNPRVDISGHFDVRAVESNVAVQNNSFQIGQFLLQMSSPVTERVNANLEVGLASDAGDVVFNEAYVDMNLYRWDGQPHNDPLEFKSVGVIMGQFDVPFGLDWRSYRSIDRLLVSVPTVINNTHRGWNDLGVQIYAETQWSNITVFAVNGFGTSRTLRLDQFNGTVPKLTAGDVGANGGIPLTEAYGSRLGLLLNDHVEFGTSFGAGYTEDNNQRTRMFGFDASIDYSALKLKGEFISRRYSLYDGLRNDLGYYVQGSYQVGRQYAVLRGDTFRPDGGPVNYATSIGGGYMIAPNAQLRAEYRWAEGSSNDTVFLQTAIAF